MIALTLFEEEAALKGDISLAVFYPDVYDMCAYIYALALTGY